MTTSDWINVLSIIIAPLVAVQITVFLQNRREKYRRKVELFKTLMATRPSGLDRQHVQALNLIDIEFYGRDEKSKAVMNAWKAYLDHLNSVQNDAWGARREDLLVALLYKMSSHLGYEFDETYIRRAAYFPRGYGDLEFEQEQMRKCMLSILKGERGFPIVGAVAVTSAPARAGEVTDGTSDPATASPDGRSAHHVR